MLLRNPGVNLYFMPEHVPDRVDRAIVATLQRDGRIANVDLADAISLSPSACLRRVKALEASGIIAGYHAEVSRARALAPGEMDLLGGAVPSRGSRLPGPRRGPGGARGGREQARSASGEYLAA
jgi:winged helix-turn-helix DNA-binding protein